MLDIVKHTSATINTQKCNKKQFLDTIDALYDLEDVLFSGLKDQSSFFKCPDRLRLPLIFYYGHTSVVFVNKMRLSRLIRFEERIDFEIEELLETGVDEMSWDDLETKRMGGSYKWPSLEAIIKYRQLVKSLIHKVIDRSELELPITWDSPWWSILMGIEHYRIHLETSSVLIRQMPIHMVTRPEQWKYAAFDNVNPVTENKLVTVKSRAIRLGKPYSFPTFGWDNEYGKKIIQVDQFQSSQFKITNDEFLKFVEDGGYEKQQYWGQEAKQWLKFTGRRHPLFWVCDEGCASSCGKNLGDVTHCKRGDQDSSLMDNNYSRPAFKYRYRLMYDVIDMPTDWPVLVNYFEAKAYCRWMGSGYRLPSEAEIRITQDVNIESQKCRYEDDPTLSSTVGNYNLEYGSCTAVNKYPANELGFYDCFGNAWEWSEDHFNALPGSRLSCLYSDFSLPCYDGKHNVIYGGSFISCGGYASYFARVGFRRHFQQFAGFRLVKADSNSSILKIGEGSEGGGVKSFAIVHKNNTAENQALIRNLENSGLYDELHQYILETAVAINKKDATLTHFGCGFGALSEKLTDKFQVFATDVLECTIPNKIGLKATYKQFSWIPNEIPKSDVVLFCSFHRLQNPLAWLLRQEDVIKDYGILIAILPGESQVAIFEKGIGPRFQIVDLKVSTQHTNNDGSNWIIAAWKRV